MRKIDEEGLKRLGFYLAEEKDNLRNIWRLKVPYYHYEFQIVLGNYHSTNPNCGVVSLYDPAGEAVGFTQKGKKKMYKYPGFCRPIAWHVDTFDRLHIIIQALSHRNIW